MVNALYLFLVVHIGLLHGSFAFVLFHVWQNDHKITDFNNKVLSNDLVWLIMSCDECYVHLLCAYTSKQLFLGAVLCVCLYFRVYVLVQYTCSLSCYTV